MRAVPGNGPCDTSFSWEIDASGKTKKPGFALENELKEEKIEDIKDRLYREDKTQEASVLSVEIKRSCAGLAAKAEQGEESNVLEGETYIWESHRSPTPPRRPSSVCSGQRRRFEACGL